MIPRFLSHLIDMPQRVRCSDVRALAARRVSELHISHSLSRASAYLRHEVFHDLVLRYFEVMHALTRLDVSNSSTQLHVAR